MAETEAALEVVARADWSAVLVTWAEAERVAA